MVKYIDSLNIIEDTRAHKRPAQMSEISRWKDTINHLFQHWTGKDCPDIQQLYRQSYLKNCGAEPILAAKIIRQVCLKHVPYFHVAVGRACYLLQDWSPADRVSNNAWLQQNRKKETTAFNSLQSEYGATLERLLNANHSREECATLMLKVPFIPDQSSTYKRLFK